MSIIIKYYYYYILLVISILENHTIMISSETPSTFTTLPKPLLPPNKSTSPSPSPSPSPHHHHPRRHNRHKHSSSQAPQPAKQGRLFFPPGPSPSPDALEFPANASSFPPPENSSSKSSTKLIVIIISIALFSVAVIAYALVLLIQHRRRHLQQSPKIKMDKSDSVRLYPPNAPASDTTSLSYNSPELRPLPPLPKQNLYDQQTYYNSTYEGNHHDEEFYSPLGVSGSPNLEVSSSCSVTGAENFRSHSLNSEITSSSPGSISQTISRCPSIASTSASRTLTQESCVNISIPRNARQTLNSDEVESVEFPQNPPSLPTPRLQNLWFKSEGKGNVSPPELGIPAKTSPPLMPPPRLRKLWSENEGISNVLPELGIPARPLPPNPPLLPPPRLRKTWFGSEGTGNVSPELERAASPLSQWKINEGGETSERNFQPKWKL
ncbi:hypothetical protein DCAR_0416080 [Daucus carota subsp. sativus]|uniref:Uncharacterized protein n=1 Tax=Daucus carota subsp. sativus TaxID=79200 RepID=A0AAF0WWC8_DAUCS|nr:PREDICTED: formin-like protein 2 [Daucus carota subsp. sativus]WOG96744.1 hypothetical protein DCAR_0416080 [Daucus carota subsp. sativus]